MNKPDNTEPEPQDSNHWELVRDVIAFQFKLAIDGLRDLLLSPVSIGAAVLGMIASPRDPAKYFRRLLRLGDQSDGWINLFGTHDSSAPSSDDYVRKVETVIKSEYHKGGLVRTVTDHADGLIRKVGKDKDGEDA